MLVRSLTNPSTTVSLSPRVSVAGYPDREQARALPPDDDGREAETRGLLDCAGGQTEPETVEQAHRGPQGGVDRVQLRLHGMPGGGGGRRLHPVRPSGHTQDAPGAVGRQLAAAAYKMACQNQGIRFRVRMNGCRVWCVEPQTDRQRETDRRMRVCVCACVCVYGASVCTGLLARVPMIPPVTTLHGVINNRSMLPFFGTN